MYAASAPSAIRTGSRNVRRAEPDEAQRDAEQRQHDQPSRRPVGDRIARLVGRPHDEQRERRKRRHRRRRLAQRRRELRCHRAHNNPRCGGLRRPRPLLRRRLLAGAGRGGPVRALAGARRRRQGRPRDRPVHARGRAAGEHARGRLRRRRAAVRAAPPWLRRTRCRGGDHRSGRRDRARSPRDRRRSSSTTGCTCPPPTAPTTSACSRTCSSTSPTPRRCSAEVARACRAVLVEVPLEANWSARRAGKREHAAEVGHLQRLDRRAVREIVARAGLSIVARARRSAAARGPPLLRRQPARARARRPPSGRCAAPSPPRSTPRPAGVHGPLRVSVPAPAG